MEMAKTALDLTRQEWKAYQPGRVSARLRRRASPQTGKRRQQAWRVARQAAALLHSEFGARRVVVFGSLAQRAWFTERSDIDLAAWGIPVDRYYGAVAVVTGLSPLFKVDLVDPETCRQSVRQAIEAEGIEL
jgi:predicted nucleotidyltransferase